MWIIIIQIKRALVCERALIQVEPKGLFLNGLSNQTNNWDPNKPSPFLSRGPNNPSQSQIALNS